MPVPEAELVRTDNGLAPKGEGWYVINARDAEWVTSPKFGCEPVFQGDVRFTEVGFHVGIVKPGQPTCYYHGENQQEDFLVLAGECILLVEGAERPLKAWDFVHCPPWTEHVFVGAGDEPCLIIAVGARKPGEEIIYPVEDVALKHEAGVETETPDPDEAYAGVDDMTRIPYPEGALPDIPPPTL
jgi:uncharacterized cupin superfamily protein